MRSIRECETSVLNGINLYEIYVYLFTYDTPRHLERIGGIIRESTKNYYTALQEGFDIFPFSFELRQVFGKMLKFILSLEFILRTPLINLCSLIDKFICSHVRITRA